MIAIDTNILVYAHREDASLHEAALSSLKKIAESSRDWAIPWPCIHEFLAIVTHPRIFNPPTPPADAIEQVDCWLEAPHLHVIGEMTTDYWKILRSVLEGGKIIGPRVHDARIASICIENGVECLWTADRDFSRIKELATLNPLV